MANEKENKWYREYHTENCYELVEEKPYYIVLKYDNTLYSIPYDMFWNKFIECHNPDSFMAKLEVL